MADDTIPLSATNIGAKDKGGTLHQKLLPWDVDLGRAQGSTFYRELFTTGSYPVLTDSIADGAAPWWTTTATNGGTFGVLTGEGLLQTSTATNGTIQITSPILPYQPGQVNWMRPAARFSAPTAGTIQRIGAFTVGGTGGIVPQDGAAFEVDGTTINAVIYKGGAVQSSTPLASWSNAAANPFTLDTNYHLWEPRWTANQFLFYIDNELRHATPASATPITNTLNFPMAFQVIKTSGATNMALGVRNAGLGRFGEQKNVGKATDYLRVTRNFFMDNYVAAPATEALMSVTQFYNNAAVAAATNPAAVPLGKVLRLDGIRLTTKSLAAAGSVVLRVRVNTAGAVTATSPIVATHEVGSQAAVAGLLDGEYHPFPDGIDIPGGANVGFTLAGYNATGVLTLQGVTRFEVHGHEYMAG